MGDLNNELINRIYYLSAIVSYPLCDELYNMTGDVGTIDTLLTELGVLLDRGDIDSAYLLFQFLMAIARMEILPEIRGICEKEITLRQFMYELFLDFEDYYDQIPMYCECDDEEDWPI